MLSLQTHIIHSVLRKIVHKIKVSALLPKKTEAHYRLDFFEIQVFLYMWVSGVCVCACAMAVNVHVAVCVFVCAWMYVSLYIM